MTERELQGPAYYIATHPAAFVASLVGAGCATVLLARRAAGAGGLRRLGWIALSALEAAVVLGILGLRKRPTSPT